MICRDSNTMKEGMVSILTRTSSLECTSTSTSTRGCTSTSTEVVNLHLLRERQPRSPALYHYFSHGRRCPISRGREK